MSARTARQVIFATPRNVGKLKGNVIAKLMPARDFDDSRGVPLERQPAK